MMSRAPLLTDNWGVTRLRNFQIVVEWSYMTSLVVTWKLYPFSSWFSWRWLGCRKLGMLWSGRTMHSELIGRLWLKEEIAFHLWKRDGYIFERWANVTLLLTQISALWVTGILNLLFFTLCLQKRFQYHLTRITKEITGDEWVNKSPSVIPVYSVWSAV